MIDLLSPELTSEKNIFLLRCKCICKSRVWLCVQYKWIQGFWSKQFMVTAKPSIKYLELFALCAGLFIWENSLKNCRITVYCDNQSVISMINNLTSGCKNCMILIRMLVLNGLKFNRRERATYVSSKNNYLSDALSRGQMSRFRRLGPQMNANQDTIHSSLWPMEKLWIWNKI